MAVITERLNQKGEKTYQAKVRIKGYPVETATFTRKTDANLWAQTTEVAMRTGKYIKTAESKKHTLEELIDRYIKYVLPERHSDRIKYETMLSWWKKKIGCYYLSEVTPALLSEYRDKLKNEPSFRDEEKKRSNATVNRYMAALSVVLTKASREWGWTEDNPMTKVSKFKEPKGRTRFLSDDERKRLLEQCDKASNPLIKLLVVIALSTGARWSEVVELTWKDVDLKNRMFYFMDTKNGEDRGVPISRNAHMLLVKHSKVRKISSDYVFVRKEGDKPTDLRWQWERIVENAELKDFRFHDLRHTAASYLAMNGATLVEISSILGHKTMDMVKRYSHLTNNHTADILERMNEKQFGAI